MTIRATSLEMKVTPGQAQPAYAFKTVFTTNTDTLSKQLDKARDAFLNTGLALKGMALTYNNTEDDNAKDAEKIRPFVDGLMADYPGASVIIPPPPGGYPPPPPGAGGGAPGGSPPKGA